MMMQMDTVKKYLVMEVFTKEILSMVNFKVRVNIKIHIVNMKEIFLIIKNMDKDLKYIQMVINFKVNFLMDNLMVRVK